MNQTLNTVKYNLSLFICLALMLPMVSCNVNSINQDKPEPFERHTLPRELSANEVQVANGSGDFGFNLMHKLLEANPDQSHVVSPLSIAMAYGMAMNGAEGETYTQMQKVFGLGGMSRDQISQSARELMELLTQFDDKVRFNIANSIWYRDTFHVEDAFIETNRRYYDAEIRATDFDDPEAVEKINEWVDSKTGGLIEEIVQGPIDPMTVMYLINAIYFNGTWTVEFDPRKTEKKPFYLADGSRVETEMMRMDRKENILYARGKNYQAVNLYYGDAGFAMTLVLPDEEVGLENWLTDTNWKKWQNLTGSLSGATVSLEMPKFEMEYEVEEFKKILQELGITDAFGAGSADFSRINPSRDDLHISDTRHKTFMRVDEKGTEAAAVTSIEVSLTSVSQAIEIHFNRPFFYMIREVESGTPLFMGTIADPSSL